MSWTARARPKRSSACSPIATPPTCTCTTPSAAATPRASSALVEPGGEHVAACAPLVLAARGCRAHEVHAVAADLRVFDQRGNGGRRNGERIEFARGVREGEDGRAVGEVQVHANLAGCAAIAVI